MADRDDRDEDGQEVDSESDETSSSDSSTDREREGDDENEKCDDTNELQMQDELICEQRQAPTKPLWRRLLHWGPILALSVVSEISMSTFYCHLMWWPPDTLWGVLDLIIFSIWVMHVVSYLVAAAHVGPGYVPLGWKPELESGGLMQYCLICKGYKAPRSHHCRKCGRCVMKMDHHCPWINNCVGHFNHAYFTKFLLSAVIGCFHATLILAPSIYRAVFRVWYMHYGNGTEPLVNLGLNGVIAAIFGLGLAVGVVLSVGFLFIIQMRSICRNRTGIEDYILSKALYRRKVDKNNELPPFTYPYHLGWRENLKQVFTWQGLPKGDGIWWPVAEGCDQFTLTAEQLSQKDAKRNHTVEYIVVREYSGRICTCWHGIRVLCCQPFSDEPRIALKLTKRILVTRWHKYWLYGQIPPTDPEKRLIRGWFPRCCVRKLSDVTRKAGESDDNSSQSQEDSNSKKTQ